jgi:hypothetical protein
VDVTNKVLDSAPVGARIIILDRKLKGPQFRLLKTLEDPRCVCAARVSLHVFLDAAQSELVSVACMC